MSAGEMTTMLAHELNQPLGAALNYLSVAAANLKRSGATEGRLVDAVALAHTQVEHATDVVQRMREFVRSREPSRQPQRVQDLVKAALRLLEPEAQSHGICVELDVPLNLGPVLADRVMIEQVLINICRNAMEAMLAVPQRSRRLHVSASMTLEQDIAIRVRDTGPGIELERAGSVFQPFSSGKKNGLGIGLSLCRSIIEYHQGKLYFEPAEGGGTEFVFTLSVA
ncbi:MAG: sensor histidine kinase [Wenzhouxiangella sp.]